MFRVTLISFFIRRICRLFWNADQKEGSHFEYLFQIFSIRANILGSIQANIYQCCYFITGRNKIKTKFTRKPFHFIPCDIKATNHRALIHDFLSFFLFVIFWERKNTPSLKNNRNNENEYEDIVGRYCSSVLFSRGRKVDLNGWRTFNAYRLCIFRSRNWRAPGRRYFPSLVVVVNNRNKISFPPEIRLKNNTFPRARVSVAATGHFI